jgi:hypothetical protein
MRPAETAASVALTLSRVLDGERPAWVSVEAWEGIRADERPEWPSDENPAVQEAINKIAVDFDLQDECDPSYITDKVEFAMQYGLRMLDASQAA